MASITQLPAADYMSDQEPGALELPMEVAESVEPPSNIVEQDDGSAIVMMDEDDITISDADFGANLAELFDTSTINRIGAEVQELIEKDVASREARDKQYADGIKRTGLGEDAPGGADFAGASRVVHPMLAKGCVDFSSRAIKELFPATGPCRTQIVGEQTDAKLEKAERKKKFMNWQLTTQVSENRSELEKLLSQVPLGGSQYKRWWWDEELGRPRTEAVFIDDVFVPYGHSDFYTSPRIAYRQNILRSEFERRTRSGLYRDIALFDSASTPEFSAASAATDKITGVEADDVAYNADGLRCVWEVSIELSLDDDPLTEGKPAPYILHLDHTSQRPLGLFRNWKESDERKRKLQWMSEWPFIPWRGGPAVGLAHLIGSMSGAATGALRAILDSAHIQNFPGALKLKGGRNAGQTISVNATEIAEIDAPAGVDDIRKLVMPFPFSGPSAVLFNVLEWLTQQAESVVSTASERIADAGANMPVGTALALIEHGSVNFSAIHARLHNALKRDLEILHRLNSEHLEDEETIEDLGELVVNRSDFDGPTDIIPVSDPNIFSEAQRYAQLQAVLQLKGDPSFAPFFKADRLLGRALRLLQVPDLDDLANLPKEAKRLSALDENYAVAKDTAALKVYMEQDDLAHLQAHVQFATSPILGANPLIGSATMQPLLLHCKDHLLALYKKHAESAVEAIRAVARVQGAEHSDDELEARATAFIDYALAQILGPVVMPALQQMQQLAGQFAPKPQATPDMVAQIQGRLQEKQLQLAHDKELSLQAAQQRQMELAHEAQIEAADRAANKQLAELATTVQLLRDQQKQASDTMLAQFAAQQEKQTLVLQSMLSNAAASPQMSGAGSVVLPNLSPLFTNLTNVLGDTLTSAVSGISEQQQQFMENTAREAEVNRVALQALQSGLSALAQATLAPREGEIIRAPGQPVRVRSIIRQDPPTLQ